MLFALCRQAAQYADMIRIDLQHAKKAHTATDGRETEINKNFSKRDGARMRMVETREGI